MGLLDGIINQLSGQINQYQIAEKELNRQFTVAREDLQKQADTAVGNANSEASLALDARQAWNMKATMLENATTNLGLPKDPAASIEKPKPSMGPFLFLGLGALGYLYWKGKLKL